MSKFHKSVAVIAFTSILSACAPETTDVVSFETVKVENYAPQGWTAKTLPELSIALQNGDVTAETLTQAYLDRIAKIDQAGPNLQSVIALNPNALDQARAIDARRAKLQDLPPLAGVPILLKDNIESADPMPTTAGAYALAENVTERDSPLVAGLRAQGAIILGKTNLSQWANFRSNESMSGWSAIGGQVRNPHMLDRSPCGSSSGSGAAIAASLAAGAVGTETNGSIICPSNVNGIVGFKPTVGLISQQYIIPISATQDTAGPTTKTVTGAAMMLSAMTTEDQTDFAAMLDAGSLSGARIGVMRFAQGENADILKRFEAALLVMENSGAELVDIHDFSPEVDNFWGKSLMVLEYEFKDGLNAYLADAAPNVATRSLSDVIAFNKTNGAELALFDQDLLESSDTKGPLTDQEYLEALTDIQTATREQGLDALAAQYDVEAFVSPSGPIATRIDPINGDIWPNWVGAGWMAAIAGYPIITVPMGDVHGLPIGLSILGLAGDDAKILSYGYAYEQGSNLRRDPRYLRDAESRPEIAAAMDKPK